MTSFNTFIFNGELYEVHFNCGRPSRIVYYPEGQTGREVEYNELDFLLQTQIETFVVNERNH